MGEIKLKIGFKLHALIVLILLLTLLGCGNGGSSGGGGGSSGNEGNNSTAGADNGSGASANVDSVTLAWDASTTNNDGSPLTDLAGYKVYYGASHNYTQTVDVGNFTGAVINNLSSGTWCFSVTAYDTSGNESGQSSEFCTTIG